MLTDSPEILGTLVGDPRTIDIEPRFQKMISTIAGFFGKLAQLRGKRATHSFGSVAFGTFEVCEELNIPEHSIFSPGNRYPVVVRHANIKGFPDDAILDGRGATVRILKGAADGDMSTIDLHDFLVDILMSTGECFTFNTAAQFSPWVMGSMEERAQLLPTIPNFLPLFHQIIRNPDSYTQLHYYSELTYLFKSAGLSPQDYYMRYRLTNLDRSADTGFIPIEEIRLPTDFLPRRADDFRPANYLQADFRQRVTTEGGVNYILQIQLQPITDDRAANELAKDCTVKWDENKYPFHDVGIVRLKNIVPDEIAEQLEFNPYHASADLALILAHSIDETASINHLRSVVYEISANMRKYIVPSSELVDWGVKQQPPTKALFPYFGTPKIDLPRFDPKATLPPRIAPKPRLIANLGLVTLPAKPADPIPLLGISGVTEIIAKLQTPLVMPANLTRCRPDKLSDEFFVERRLNGFNPGKFKPVKDLPWQYIIRYNCRNYIVKPAGILPAVIEARFVVEDRSLKVHSIEYELNGETIVNSPSDWLWAKRLFRSAEFVFQESQSHLARTHLNIEQYAMAYYRNIADNPIKLLLEPHLEGLVNVNKLGDSIIFGPNGVIPQASALDEVQVARLIQEEVAELNYHNWHPSRHFLADKIDNNHFDPAASAAWSAIEEYVNGFFTQQGQNIENRWDEVIEMSRELVEHSILKPEYGTLEISSVDDLKQLCIYIIYHSTFFHSWVNYKQYEDGGDVDYTALGLWDAHHSAYDPIAVGKKQVQQVIIAWTLSGVRYNPLMESPSPLKDCFWRRRAEITPGLPLENLMTSIHI
jgi:linolenate 9R-lipoxygenase